MGEKGRAVTLFHFFLVVGLALRQGEKKEFQATIRPAKTRKKGTGGEEVQLKRYQLGRNVL